MLVSYLAAVHDYKSYMNAGVIIKYHMALDIGLYVLLCDLVLKRLAGVMLPVKVVGLYFNVAFVVVKKTNT